GGQPIPGHTLPTGFTLTGSMKADYDQLGNETDSYSDLSGRLTDVFQPPVSGATAHWQYSYDADGNETRQIDPNGGQTTWIYDALGNKVQRTLPLGQTGQALAPHQHEDW